MATFVIHLYRLQEDLKKLAEQLVFHEKNLLADGKKPINHNLKFLIKEVENFKTDFDDLINKEGNKNVTDIYGSKYALAYRYAEVTYENQARIKTIRLLGTGVPPLRFFISNVLNPFSITTLKMVADIRELVKKKQTPSLADLFKCEEDGDFFHDMKAVHSVFSQDKKEEYKYNWQKFETYFSPSIKYSENPEMTDEKIEKLVQEHHDKTIQSKNELEAKLQKIEKEKVRLIENRKKKLLKAPNPAEELEKVIKDGKKRTESLNNLEQSAVEFGSELSKAKDQVVQKGKDIIFDWLDRHTIGCLIEEAIKCVLPANVDCKDVLGSLTPGEIFDRLSLVFPKGSDTFQEIEKAVENSLYEGTGIPDLKNVVAGLKNSIEQDQRFLQQLKNTRDSSAFSDPAIISAIANLQEKIFIYEKQLQENEQKLEIALINFSSDMNLSEAQAKEIKNGGGNIAAILSLPQEGTQLGVSSITGKIIAAIDTVVPLEDLCQAIISGMSSGFAGFDFKLPEPKQTDDIFAGFAGKIGQIIGALLVEAIVSFIQSMLEDLINCDNLDNFISKMVNSSMTGEEVNLLNQLFGGDSAEQIIQDNYEQFTNTFAVSASKNIKNAFDQTQANIISEEDIKAILTPNINFKEGVNKEKILQESALTLVDLAEASGKTTVQVNEQIFGTGQYVQSLFNQGKIPDGNWMIDSTGTKFEIVDGIRIIDLQEVDKFLSSLSENSREAIKENANISRQALIDAFGQPETQEDNNNQTTNTSQKEISLVLSESDKDNIKNEFLCIMKHITSLLAPSQTLALFAGTATEEVVSLAAEIVNLCAPNLKLVFTTNNKISNMLSTFGNIAGLDNMKDSVELLATSNEFNNFAIQPERCGPYDSISDFRKDLMLKIVEPSKAEKILEELNKERIQKFREIGNSLIDMANGASPEISKRSPNKLVLDSIKAVLNNQQTPISAPPSNRKRGKSIEKQIQKAIDDEFKNSPVVQNIYKKMLDSLFRPIDMSFRSDMDGFIEAFSDIVEKEEVVNREIRISVGGKKIKTINPIFKELLDSNLIPAVEHKSGPKEKKEKYAKMVDKSNFDIIKIGEGEESFKIIKDREETSEKSALYVSGEPSKNYLVKGLNRAPIKPVLRKVNRKEIAAPLKRNLPSLQTNSEFKDNQLRLYLSGSLKDIQDSYIIEAQKNLDLSDEVTTVLSALKENKPSWSIGFEEFEKTGITFNKISVNTFGQMAKGTSIDPFYLEKAFEINSPSRPVKNIRNLLIEKYETDNKQRKQVFDNIFFENIKYFIQTRGDLVIEQRFSQNSAEFYNKLMKAFLIGSVNGILFTNLLLQNQDVKNKTGQSITNIEALNFSAKCKTILDFENLKKEYTTIYDTLEEPEVTLNQRKGLEPRPSRTKEASLLMISKTLVRLLCFETLLKALPAFEYYKYSSSLIKNEITIKLVCNFIESELNRIEIKAAIFENIKKYYKKQIELETGEYESISEQEKEQHSLLKNSYPIELKKIVEKEFEELLKKTKEIGKVEEELGLSKSDDFIRPILERMKVVNVHRDNGIASATSRKDIIFSRSFIDEEFVLQKYIRMPNINRQSRIVKDNPQYFTEQKIASIQNKVVTFTQAAEIFSEILYSAGTDYNAYDCDDIENSLFSEPYRAGLRIVYVEKKTKYPEQGPSPVFKIGKENYPFFIKNCEQEKLGYIIERTINPRKEIYYNTDYNVIKIAAEEIIVNQTENAKTFINRNNENRYMEEFFVELKTKLLKNIDVNLLFAYAIPLKEMASMLILHTNLASNSYKMKYLLEPTKNTISNITNTLLKMGDKTKNPIDDMMAGIFDSMANMGNPAGPLDPDALKMYARTPIQILKSLATIVDPNIALADKINSGISLAGSLIGEKIFIPYSALSLALLPAPIFGGLIPYIPPLTAYNLAPPLGPAFLLLEPLLWDLPWFQGVAKPEEEIECEDKE